MPTNNPDTLRPLIPEHLRITAGSGSRMVYPMFLTAHNRRGVNIILADARDGREIADVWGDTLPQAFEALARAVQDYDDRFEDQEAEAMSAALYRTEEPEARQSQRKVA